MSRFDALEARVFALESRLSAAERRLPPAPRAAAPVQDEGVVIRTPARIGPLPSDAEVDRLIIKLGADRPELAPFLEHDSGEFRSDFAKAYLAMGHWGRAEPLVSGMTAVERVETWLGDAGLGRSVSGPAFICAAAAIGDVKMTLGQNLSGSKFGLARFART